MVKIENGKSFELLQQYRGYRWFEFNEHLNEKELRKKRREISEKKALMWIEAATAAKFSDNHKKEIMRDDMCGCYYCTYIFNPQEIDKSPIPMDWIMDWSGTALCPNCDIDAVIGESSGFPIVEEFLQLMHLRSFKGSYDTTTGEITHSEFWFDVEAKAADYYRSSY